MKNTELCTMYRSVARSLSPTQTDRDFVSEVYAAVKDALPGNCFMTGSYARFTASRPLHDLDVLFDSGRFDINRTSPKAALLTLETSLRSKFKNPTPFRVQISQQSHSVTISFLHDKTEHFAVDVVPAFTSGSSNEFGQPTFWVPEIARTSRRNRPTRYAQLQKTAKQERDWWVLSDPLGYIQTATNANAANPDFRKLTKFIKKWKHSCHKQNPDFTLKSFHIEQAVLALLYQNPRFGIAEAACDYFCELPKTLLGPQIKDRADQTKYIDEYVRELTPSQRKALLQARDSFLIRLEQAAVEQDIANLLSAGFHQRASDSEAYLFDSGIPVYLEKDAALHITATVMPRAGGFRQFILDKIGLINIDRRISFSAKLLGPYQADYLKWKVKNDDNSPQPRGEITNHRTKNDPESTKFDGLHFTECYAIKGHVCIARDRQNVRIKRP